DSLAASTITKHAGRAFGSICLSNFALRSGLLMWTLGGEVPPDATIRLQDSLAALPLCEPRAGGDHEEIEASKRLLAGLLTYKPPRSSSTAWEEATTTGIPKIVARNSMWSAVRQQLLARKRRRAPELEEFGGSDATWTALVTQCCSPYLRSKSCQVTLGDAEGWRKLLQHLKDKRVADWNAESSHLLLRYSLTGHRWLEALGLSSDAVKAFVNLPMAQVTT
ncbi:unnamed protein product, partial [Effrenium voratum]